MRSSTARPDAAAKATPYTAARTPRRPTEPVNWTSSGWEKSSTYGCDTEAPHRSLPELIRVGAPGPPSHRRSSEAPLPRKNVRLQRPIEVADTYRYPEDDEGL